MTLRDSGPRKTTYAVFVRFRHTRLRLRRGISTVEAAFAFANEVRALRFHDPEEVFVAREPDGVIVIEPAPTVPVAGTGILHAPDDEAAPVTVKRLPRSKPP
jgi:hypothetical protein